ncbi:kinase [bacterium]|nr:kinase [bacterium]MBU3955144.1 kinase [bacterium]MBU4133819.1 kinase [bacterium]
MIIARVPLRISFFGGGTDYSAWLSDNDGAVLSTTIDKYIYITARYLPPFFEHKSRIVWSLIETPKRIDEIKHPSVRECLRFMRIKKGVEIHYDADLPSRTGLGSSSSFTTGLLNSLYALKGQLVSKDKLAADAIHVEQDLLKENVGSQDQIAAAFGGFNLINFPSKGKFIVTPVTIAAERLKLLNQHLLLVFTGFSRFSSEVAGRIIKNVKKRKNDLRAMKNLVDESVKILVNEKSSIEEFGKLLHENWLIKKDLAEGVTIPVVDDIYREARRNGAIGGKLLGAGGGGFVLIFAEPQKLRIIKKRLKKFLIVPFEFERMGSQIIFYNPETEYEFK